MQLRLACNSPHNFYWPWSDDETPDTSLITESGKMLLLERLGPALLKQDHKLLIFSQFKTQLDILEDWACLLHDWPVCRIDGGVKPEERRDQISAFNNDPAVKIFLLSTRAGGQGINLAAADTVILYDSDWNPQQDLQAQDRAHRIGQKRPVIVYRLATKGTIEQTLLDKAESKRRLEKLVIHKGQFKTFADSSVGGNDSKKSIEEELMRMLMTDDFQKYDLGGGEREVNGKAKHSKSLQATAARLLSEADLKALTDRSEEAYERAATATSTSSLIKVVDPSAAATNGAPP